MLSVRYSSQILKELEFSRQILERYSNIKFHENPSVGAMLFPCGRTAGLTEGHGEGTNFLQSCELS